MIALVVKKEMKMSSLGVVMIVKNEEKVLERCLKSIEGVDEIVICDTGSTDNTVKIAEKFTDKVYTDYEWEDSFAKARNHAKSKSTTDWILSIDADEYLQDGGVALLRKSIKYLEGKKFEALGIRMNAEGTDDIFYFPRLFKNSDKIQWKGAAHNWIDGIKGKHPNAEDIIIVYGYSPAHKKDPDRTLRILKKEVDNNKELKRERYYLAREYFYRKDWITALYHYEEYLKKGVWHPELADAWIMKAKCLWYLQRGEEARDAVMQAIKINPDFKEAYLVMSDMVYEQYKPLWLKHANNCTNQGVLFVRNYDRPK